MGTYLSVNQGHSHEDQVGLPSFPFQSLLSNSQFELEFVDLKLKFNFN